MRQENKGAALCGWVKGLAVAVALVAVLPAVASSMPAVMSISEAQQSPESRPATSTDGALGLPEKPAGLDDAGWASLQQAIRKAATEQAKLSRPASTAGAEGSDFDAFGVAVAVDGETALVGANGDSVGAKSGQGSAYVFIRSGSSWTLQAKLTAGDGTFGDRFGDSVALDGDTALVGASGDDVGANPDQGSVYVFTRIGSTWTQAAKLIADDGAENDFFGSSVALDGDTALTGALGDDVGVKWNQGSAYVFTRSGATWSQQQKLIAADGESSAQFGRSVALNGDSLLVGAPFQRAASGFEAWGAAYVFTRSGLTWTEQAKLSADDPAGNDGFGNSVALDGDTALVGASFDDVGPNIDQGSAYVFTRIGTTWTQQAKLTAADGAAGDIFAASVALRGDTALVGASFDDVGAAGDQGSAYVFVRTGSDWAQQAQLTVIDPPAVGQVLFGSSVALDGGAAFVGATSDSSAGNSAQGSTSVFARIGSTWTHQEKLTTGDGPGSEGFGYAVDVDGGIALVGAPREGVGSNLQQGSAYVFMLSGTTWTLQAKLTALDGAAFDRFGHSVALNGDTALVGAYSGDVGANFDQGAAYVFSRSGMTWTQQAKLTAGDGAEYDNFGWSVALDGDTALVGAYQDDVGADSQQGSAYIFTRTGATWPQQAKLTASDGEAGDRFGVAVALDGDTALVGANLDDVEANFDQGSAYVFARSETIWMQQAKLTAGDGAQGDQFGSALALSGETVLVGVSRDAVGANSFQGSAYVFTRSGTIWAQQAQLTAIDGAPFDQFGYSVALDGDTALVGAVLSEVGANNEQGSAYVFARGDTTWTQQVQLTAGDGAANDLFGTAVALSKGLAIIGAGEVDGLPPFGNPGEGAAYVFSGVGQMLQSITFANPGAQAFGTTPTLTATASSGLPVDFSSDTPGVCTVNAAGTLSFAAVGTCTINADQAGDAAFKPAPRVQQSFAVNAVAPAAPTIGAATAGDGEASVSFGEPAFAGGAPITGYTVISNPDGLTGTGTGVGSPITVTGLSNGVAYTFTVTATNSAGTGAASEASNAVTPRGAQAALTAIATPSTVAFGATSTLSTTGGSGGGEVSYAITAGAAFCSLSGSTLTATAIGTCTVTATKAAEGAFNAATATVEVTVVRAEQAALTATASPSSIAFGGTSALATTGGSGTGAVSFAVTAGTEFCSISSTTLTGTGVGTCTVTATKAADDNFNAATATVEVTVGRAEQAALTATASPSSIAFGGTSTLGTTGGSGTGAVSFAVTAGGEFCSISSTTLTGTGVGTCTVTATKAADANFNAAVATVDVAVGRAEQAALTATASPSSIAFGGTSTLGTTGGSGTGAVSYAISAGSEFCSISGTTLTGTGVGTCTVTATKAADANFNAATATVEVTVGRADQAPLTATASPSSIAFGGTSTLATTGGSGTGAVSFAVTAGGEFCSISGTMLTGTGIGTCTVTAIKAADANFNAATATVEVTVGRAEQAPLTATASSSSIAFGGTSTLGTTGGSGAGAVSFAITAGGEFCSLSGTTLTGIGVGTCTVTATKAADANFNAATATVEVTVGRADQAALTATASPSSIAFGGTSTLATTGGSGTGAVSYAVTAGSEFCSITGITLTGTGVGTCTVTATKAADANFNAATAMVSVTVARANQAPLSVTATPSAIPLTRTTALAATGGSGSGEVSFAVTAGAANCSISGSTLTGTGVGACTVTATKAGDAQFNPATAQATVVVQAATDLEISKDDGTQYALPQGTVLYEILVANAGPLAVEGARLRDVLPAGLAEALWTCTPLQLASCPQAAGEGGIDQTLTLPVNGVLSYRLSARVTAPLGSTLINTATIEAPAGVIELQPSDNSASDSNLVVPEGLFGNGFEAAPNRISVPVRG